MATGEQVAVDVEGRVDFRVAHELLYRFRIRPGVDQHRSEGVAAYVQADWSEQIGLASLARRKLSLALVRGLLGPLRAAIDRRGVERLLSGASEHKVLSAPSHPAQVRFQVAAENRQHRHAAPSRTRLGLDYALNLVPASLNGVQSQVGRRAYAAETA
jgi:hypothetical protein